MTIMSSFILVHIFNTYRGEFINILGETFFTKSIIKSEVSLF